MYQHTASTVTPIYTFIYSHWTLDEDFEHISKINLNSPVLFWSIVDKRAIEYKHQNFLKVVVHVSYRWPMCIVIITRIRWNPGNGYNGIATLFLSLWRQTVVDRLTLRHLGHWQTVQIQITRRKTRCLIRICTVCLNNRKLRIKWNSPKSPFRTIFPACTQRQSTHQYSQCFDYFSYSASTVYLPNEALLKLIDNPLHRLQ